MRFSWEVIEGVAETTASLLKLISGIISDKIGKRKLLVLIGYSISSLIRPMTGLVSAAWELIIVRMFDRVGKGIRTAPRDALIALPWMKVYGEKHMVLSVPWIISGLLWDQHLQ